jgi:hypothetical protein
MASDCRRADGILCRPTAPTVIDPSVELLDDAVRCLKMPRRNRTRAQTRTRAIDEERRANEADLYELPPF